MHGSLLVAVIGTCASLASADTVSVKLTTDALGLGSADLNSGGVVSPDIAGKLITSNVTGQGSILYIQQSGLAGSGTAFDPLLCTITARTRLDTVSGLPASHDYQAGVIYLSNENKNLPDGKNEGLGVRAFTVNPGNGADAGKRQLDKGLAKIEGSRDVSGGTGPSAYDPSKPNGAPHVDEDVIFTFDPQSLVLADSLVVTMSKFDASDRIDLAVSLKGGGRSTFSFFGPPHPAFDNPGDAVWDLSFAALGFKPSDVVTSFEIRAIDKNPAEPQGTAEHFLITGFRGTIVPAPGAGVLGGLATLVAFRRRR